MSKKKRKRGASSPPPKPSAGAPNRMPAIALAAVGVFVVLVAIWIWRSEQGGAAGSAAAASPSAPGVPTASAKPGAPFVGRHYPSQGHAHLDPNEPDDFVYNSNPPSSGPHKEIFSDQFVNPSPLQAYIQVHLLEHGNVLLQYSCTCPDVVSQLSSIAYGYDKDLIAPNELQPTTAEVQAGEEAGKAVVVAPYPGMKEKIALTAWTRVGFLTSVDRAKIDSFISSYLNNEANAGQ